LFYKPLASIIGPNAPIFIPKVAQPVEEHLSDYEVELTIVIGKVAKNVSEADALDYVLGYTGANDVSHISWFAGPLCLMTATIIGIIPQAPTDNVPMGIF
jgi:2-keto-4-pentenoate hydratase/2-oxohepta-3-ene-1,7-dioic acid hydratase in catechol pathway